MSGDVVMTRESYEGEAGGWHDGRLGQAYDLIDAYLVEIGMTSGRHKLLAMIEELDENGRDQYELD